MRVRPGEVGGAPVAGAFGDEHLVDLVDAAWEDEGAESAAGGEALGSGESGLGGVLLAFW